MSLIFDTNFLIGLLRGIEAYWEYLQEVSEEALPSISAVTRAEIYAGCHPQEQSQTSELLKCFRSISVGTEIADLAGESVYRFGRRGVTLHLEDALIGATAIVEGLVLVTHNVSHFPMLSLGKNLTRFPPR
jgi:predicted nucleic acid-binding protein